MPWRTASGRTVPWRSASELSRLRLKRPERLVRLDAKDTNFFFPDVDVVDALDWHTPIRLVGTVRWLLNRWQLVG